MYQDEEVCSQVKESDVFATINRIDKKITSLRSILTPILRSYPQDSAKDIEPSTELLKMLKSIENNLSDLSQSIEL